MNYKWTIINVFLPQCDINTDNTNQCWINISVTAGWQTTFSSTNQNKFKIHCVGNENIKNTVGGWFCRVKNRHWTSDKQSQAVCIKVGRRPRVKPVSKMIVILSNDTWNRIPLKKNRENMIESYFLRW